MSNLFSDEVFYNRKELEIPDAMPEKEGILPDFFPNLEDELLHDELSKRAHPLDEVESLLRKTVILKSDSHFFALALWIAYCHAIFEFDFSPRLGIWSPEKRCGKSLLLEIIQHLTPNSIMTSSITAPALYRMREKDESLVFLIDESDTVFGRNGNKERAEALRGIVNSGFKRGSDVIVCDVKTNEPRKFPTFGAVVLAGIGTTSIPDTITDRSVLIEMRRKRADESITEFESDEVEGLFYPVRDYLREWMSINRSRLRPLRLTLPPELNSRAKDTWKPLFKIAELSGEMWKARAVKASCELSVQDEGSDDGSLSLRALSDIREFFTSERMSSRDIINALRAIEDAPWAYMTSFNFHTLAFYLKNYGIKPRSFGNSRGYVRADFEDAWGRYLPKPPPDTVNPSKEESSLKAWRSQSFDD